MMNSFEYYLNKNVLITTLNWFYAPNGVAYRSIYGKVSYIHLDESKKIQYVEMGNVFISGTEILNMIITDSINSSDANDYIIEDGNVSKVNRPSHIFNASVPKI